MALEYGKSYLEQNDEAIARLTEGMTPAAAAFAWEMAKEMMAEDDAVGV